MAPGMTIGGWALGATGIAAVARATRRRGGAVVLLAASLAVTGCSTVGAIKETFLGGSSGSGDTAKRLSGFIGGVVPRLFSAPLQSKAPRDAYNQ